MSTSTNGKESTGSIEQKDFTELPMPNEQNSDFDENKILIYSQTARSRAKISAERNDFLNSTTPPRYVTRSHSVSSDDEISPEIISTTSEKSSIIYQDSSTLATEEIEKSTVLLESHDDSFSISHSHLLNSGVIVQENNQQLDVRSQDLSPTSCEKLEEFSNLEDFETVRTSNVQCKIELSDNYKRKSILGFESENQSFDSNYLGDVSSVLFEDDERLEMVPQTVSRLTRKNAKVSRSVQEENKRSMRTNARANVDEVKEGRRITRSAKSLGQKSCEVSQEIRQFEPSNLVHHNEFKNHNSRDLNTRSAKEKSAKLSRSDVEIESHVATVDDQSQQDKNLILFDSSEQKLSSDENFDYSRTDKIVSESVNCTDDGKQSSEQFEQKEGGPDDSDNDEKYESVSGKYESVSTRRRSKRVINERKSADSKINHRTALKSPEVLSRDSVITCKTTRSAVNKPSRKLEQMENETLRISYGITKTRKSERDPEAAVDSSNFTEVQNKVPEVMITTDQGSLQELYQSTLDQNLEARLSIVGSKIREFVEAFQDINPGSNRTSKNGDDNDVGKIENRESVENLAESTNVIYQQPNKKEVEKLSCDQISSGSNEESESRQSTREPFDSPRKSKISDQQSSKNLARRLTCVNIGTTATVTFSKLNKQHLRNFAKTRQSVSLLPSQPTERKSVQNEFENVCTQFTESKNRKRVNFDVQETNEKNCFPNSERGGSGTDFSRVPKSLPERFFVENCEFTSSQAVRASERKAGKLKRMTLKRVTRATRGVSKAQEIENDHLGSDVDLQIQPEERTENCALDRDNSQENFPANPSQPCHNSAELLTERERLEDVEVERLSSITASDVEGEQLQLCTEEILRSFNSGAHQFQWDQQVRELTFILLQGLFAELSFGSKRDFFSIENPRKRSVNNLN